MPVGGGPWQGLDENVNDVHFLNVVHEETIEGDRRARNRAKKLDEIARVAMELVRDEGLEGLTTHALAKRLDVAVGALYRYFPSKSALVAELERRSLERLRTALTRALDDARGAFRGPNAPLARLVLLARAYGRFAREHPVDAGLIGQIVADPRTLVPGSEGAALMRTTLSLLGVVRAQFTEAANEDALSDGVALQRAVLFWSGLRGVLELSKLSVHAPGFEAAPLADAMVRALLTGFGADPEALARAFAAVRRYEDRPVGNVSEEGSP